MIREGRQVTSLGVHCKDRPQCVKSSRVKKLLMVASYSILFALLFYGYYVYIVSAWEYYGFRWLPNWTKIIESLFLVWLSVFFLPTSICKPSDFFVHLQFLVPILPMLVLFGAMDQPRFFVYSTEASFFIILLVVKWVRIKTVRVPKIKPDDLQILLLAIGYLVIASIVVQGGMRYFNLNIAKVYEYRSAAAENLPRVYGYINPWVSKVVFPFAFLLALLAHKRSVAFLSLIGSVLMFALTAHKGVLFYPFMVIGLYWIMGAQNPLVLIWEGYIVVIGISMIDYWLGIFSGWVATLFLRRAIFIPALLNYLYYDFFSHHGFVYWAQSKITLGLLPYKFNLGISNLIGEYYFANATTDANTGWIGSGYAHAGLWGMLIYAFLIGMIFSLLDSYTKFHDKRVVIAIFIAPLLALMVSSDLPTALLTHGTLFGLVLLLFFRTSSVCSSFQLEKET